MMLVKNDLCGLNNTESFLYTISCNVALLSVLFLLENEFRPIGMLIFAFLLCVFLLFTLLYLII